MPSQEGRRCRNHRGRNVRHTDTTTGNGYSASGALWAAATPLRRMGIIEISKGKRLKAKAMVVGATGAIGSVCSRLLVITFEIYMVMYATTQLMAAHANQF
ncbi:MAG: hypothetical protein R3F37_07815 [Candidatus Competibacteraceae bacterium]